MKVDRGIILPLIDKLSYMSNPEIGGAVEFNPISPSKVRFALLYWDKIALIESEVFSIQGLKATNPKPELQNHCRDLIALQKAGVLKLENHFGNISSIDGYNLTRVSDLYNLYSKSHLHTISKLTRKNPGQWACGNAEPNFILNSNSLIEDAKNIKRLDSQDKADYEKPRRITGDIELLNCLPVPPNDIRLEEILEFKLKRESELVALRVSLDELYLAIANSNDIPRAKITQIQKLELALKDLEKTTYENWQNRLFKKQTISIDLNLETISKGIAAGVIVGTNFTNPLGGLIAGTTYSIASSIKFTVSNEPQLKSRVGNQIDLSYVQAAKNENVVVSNGNKLENFATMTITTKLPGKRT